MCPMVTRGKCNKNAARTSVAALLMTILLLSCASDEAARYYGDVRYAPRSAEEVDVLYQAPTRAYIVLADIQARNVSPSYMQRRAAEIGADAVIIVRSGGSYSRSEVWADQDRYKRTYSRLLATAIKYQ